MEGGGGELRSWALQMTLQKVFYKAVVGIDIIHVWRCVNIVCMRLNKEEHLSEFSLHESVSKWW